MGAPVIAIVQLVIIAVMLAALPVANIQGVSVPRLGVQHTRQLASVIMIAGVAFTTWSVLNGMALVALAGVVEAAVIVHTVRVNH